MHYLAPGSEAELVFTLKEMPTKNIFETEIAVTWTNKDGSKGGETVPVRLTVVKAAPGKELLDPDFGHEFYQEQKIELLWIFENKVEIELPEKTGTEESPDPELKPWVLDGGTYYFGENGSMTVTTSKDYSMMRICDAVMFNPQISGDVSLTQVEIEVNSERKDRSTIDIAGALFGCVIDSYDELDVKAGRSLWFTTIANSAGGTITASGIYYSTLMNNFVYGSSDNRITEIIVTEPTSGDSSDDTDFTGFYGNAVIGPAKVLYKDGDSEPVLARALDCYYLPTAEEGDNRRGSWVPSEINKLECAGSSTVYIEGVNEEARPAILENCPTFLISTKRVPGAETVTRDEHLSYRLVSEFSNNQKKGEPFGYRSYSLPDGSIEAENIEWAADGLSCTYTVYTSVGYWEDDDIYTLTGLDIPVQYDDRNPIHDRTTESVDLEVDVKKVDNDFEVSWDYSSKPYIPCTRGVLLWGPVGEEPTGEWELTEEQFAANKITIPYSEWSESGALNEGVQYTFKVILWAGDYADQTATEATGVKGYYVPCVTPGEDISLLAEKVDDSGALNLSGKETATLTLRANKSFNMKNGLKITAFANEKALEITSVVPGDKAFSGIARDGDQTVIEIAPAGISEETDSREQFAFAGETIATLTIQGKNVTDGGLILIDLADFFDKPVLDEKNEGIAFALPINTTAVSGGGNYTPPKKNTTTQTLPDGTLVTTTTNSDGSIQIVYKRTDGVSSTVKTPAKGEQSTASISLPAAMAGKNVKVPIPVAAGGITTVAVLVGADGKEQVIPGSVWKDGVLTVPLAGNANIIIRDNAKSFGDVAADHWGAAAVAFVTSRELFRGVGDDSFAPNQPTSRAMLFVVLQRLAGETALSKNGESWYDSGMAWAKEKGISDGAAPMENITRQQLAVMLYRYVGSPAATQSTSVFSDSVQIAGWAQSAMDWAVEKGIFRGTDGALNPEGQATRAEVAAMLAHFISNTD